ncbi:hypothetical protein ACWCQM_34300 [Streptomyces sp. NPDC002125]
MVDAAAGRSAPGAEYVEPLRAHTTSRNGLLARTINHSSSLLL